MGGVWEVKKVATEGDANPIINNNEAGVENGKQKPSENNPEIDKQTHKQTLTVEEIDELLLDESLTDEEIAYLQLQKETILSKGVE